MLDDDEAAYVAKLEAERAELVKALGMARKIIAVATFDVPDHGGSPGEWIDEWGAEIDHVFAKHSPG